MKLREQDLPRLRRKLQEWFSSQRRDLPWRRTRDPYRIWISEIMLQQTRVAAVIPYYEKFLERFPDVRALASAPQEEVLRLWSGLGYYTRARNLQRAAREIVERHGGEFPRNLEDALALPGIGRYSAAAILSIAYEEPLAVLDGNVARVLARIEAIRGDPRESARWKRLQQAADALLDGRAPGAWNQTVMELGATVCTPRAPVCLLCPAAKWCRARQLGLTDVIPEKRCKRKPIQLLLAAAVFTDRNGRTLLVPPRDATAGEEVSPLFSRMWQFPAVHVRRDAKPELRRYLAEEFGTAALKTAELEALEPVRHGVTFRAITISAFRVRVPRLPRSAGSRSIELGNLTKLPVSNLTRKIARAATAPGRPG